jgi:hypothetical protein
MPHVQICGGGDQRWSFLLRLPLDPVEKEPLEEPTDAQLLIGERRPADAELVGGFALAELTQKARLEDRGPLRGEHGLLEPLDENARLGRLAGVGVDRALVVVVAELLFAVGAPSAVERVIARAVTSQARIDPPRKLSRIGRLSMRRWKTSCTTVSRSAPSTTRPTAARTASKCST